MIIKDYQSVRSILGVIAGIGWLATLMGAVLAMVSLGASGGWPMLTIYGGSIFVAGLGMAIGAQIASAQIDTAENTKKLVEIMSRDCQDRTL